MMFQRKRVVFIFSAVFIVFSFSVYAQNTINPKHSDAGLTCKDCHATGTPDKKAPASTCKSCHSKEDLTKVVLFEDETGKKQNINPHDAHAGDLRCTLCHSIHGKSNLYCNTGCHHTFKYDVP